MELGVLTKLLIAIRILESYKVGYTITEYTQKKNLIVFFSKNDSFHISKQVNAA